MTLVVSFIYVFVISYCHVCLHTLLVVPWMHHVCLTCCATLLMWPCFDQVLIIERTRKMSIVNVCVSLTCGPCCINVSLMFALPGLHPCCVTVLQYPVASKTCTCLGHIIFRIGKWSRLRLQRDCRLLHLFMENFIKWVGLNLNSSMHDFSRLYLVCTGCRDGGVWR